MHSILINNSLSEQVNDEELIKRILELCLVDNPTMITEKRKLMTQLKTMIQQNRTVHVIVYFK